MARIRTIKPEQPKDEELASLPIATRYLFAFLPTHADREGRLEDRHRVLKLEIFPWDDVNVEEMLIQLSPHFIIRYESAGKRYIQIRTFLKHQRPNSKEGASIIPAPTKEQVSAKHENFRARTIPEQARHESEGGEGKGREGKGKEIKKGMDVVPLAPEARSVQEQPQKQLTPQQIIVRYFKEAKGVDADDKEWDKRHWNGRLGKDANAVLRAFAGDAKKAGEYILVKGLEWEHLPDWGLNGVVAAAGRDPRLNGGEHGRTDDEVGAARLDGQRRHRGTSSSRSIVGETVRAIEQSRVRPEGSGDVDGPGEDQGLHDEEFA